MSPKAGVCELTVQRVFRARGIGSDKPGGYAHGGFNGIF